MPYGKNISSTGKSYGGEYANEITAGSNDSVLVQHGGEWKEDIKTGVDRSPVKKRHIDEYPGMDSPGEHF